MKVTVKIFKEVKFIIDLVSENGTVVGHISLVPGIPVFAKYYQEENDKWIEGHLKVIEGVIWFVRRSEDESWPVDERLLENTNLYNLWNPDWGQDKLNEEK